MRNINILIKPASGNCNLACKYCFYVDEMKKRSETSYGIMNFSTAEMVIKKALAYSNGGSITFGFQGGEPTLAGINYFRQFAKCVKENNRGAEINYTIQTNGTLINEEWIAFFREENFLVGLSLDGIEDVHDKFRISKKGSSTFNSVITAAKLLKKADVDFNILTVVTAQIAENIEQVFSYYKNEGLYFQQYIPCLDPVFEERGKNEWSLSCTQYGQFLIKLFDLWYLEKQIGSNVYVHYFENLAAMLLGYAPQSCGMMGFCSAQNIIESNGDVYPCDFYAMDKYKLGNIHQCSFEEFDRARIPFLKQSTAGLENCSRCEYGFICRGGCRRDRQNSDFIGDNWLCEAYKAFFKYALPKLKELLKMSGYIE